MARTEISIGGKLPAMLLQEFLDSVGSTGAKINKHDGEAFVAKTAEQLRQALDENWHLRLVACQVRQFEELECWCVKHSIAFDRHDNARIVCFRAGMERPMSSDNGGEALLDAGNIRPLAREVARLVTVTLTRQKLLAAVTKIIRHLNSLLPPELPPLEIGE